MPTATDRHRLSFAYGTPPRWRQLAWRCVSQEVVFVDVADCLAPVAHTGLGEDVVDVSLDGGIGEHKGVLISALDMPRAMSWSISISRLVEPVRGCLRGDAGRGCRG
jgi:hypothetical protein